MKIDQTWKKLPKKFHLHKIKLKMRPRALNNDLQNLSLEQKFGQPWSRPEVHNSNLMTGQKNLGFSHLKIFFWSNNIQNAQVFGFYTPNQKLTRTTLCMLNLDDYFAFLSFDHISKKGRVQWWCRSLDLFLDGQAKTKDIAEITKMLKNQIYHIWTKKMLLDL